MLPHLQAYCLLLLLDMHLETRALKCCFPFLEDREIFWYIAFDRPHEYSIHRIWSNPFPFPSHPATKRWVTILSVLIPNSVVFLHQSFTSMFETTFLPSTWAHTLLAWAHQHAPSLIFLAPKEMLGAFLPHVYSKRTPSSFYPCTDMAFGNDT